MPTKINQIVFLGNSITDNCEWAELFQNSKIVNRGIGGDVIVNITSRIDNVFISQVDKIFLMIIVNHLQRGYTMIEIIKQYDLLPYTIKKKSSNAKVYIQSVLPVDIEGFNHLEVIKLNLEIAELAHKYNFIYVNLFDKLKSKDGKLDEKYSDDGMYLNGASYLVWKNAILDLVNDSMLTPKMSDIGNVLISIAV